MTLLELAQKLRPYIEKAAISLSDNYEGILYKCLQAHIPQAAWTPTAAPSLWAKVLIPDANVIPEWE